MRCMRLLLCLLCVTVCSRAGLINPSFETGDFTGWTIGGNSISKGVAADGTLISGTDAPFSPAFVNALTGNFAGFAVVKCGNGCSPLELITLSQVVAVAPSAEYLIGFFLGNDSPSPVGFNIDDNHLQIFVDGVGLLPSNPTPFVSTGSMSGDMERVAGIFATGSRSNVTVKFQISASGTSRAGLSFDEFFLESIVPEPGSAALIAIGLALLWLSKTALAARNHHAL
jgi:hypothetical protein